VPAIGALFHINSHDAVNDHRSRKIVEKQDITSFAQNQYGFVFSLRFAMHPAAAVQYRHVQFD
jgi:hypothetical protein